VQQTNLNVRCESRPPPEPSCCLRNATPRVPADQGPVRGTPPHLTELLTSEGARILLRTVAGDGKPTRPGMRPGHDHSRAWVSPLKEVASAVQERADTTSLEVAADGEAGQLVVPPPGR
jgi:hypothetical protein